MATRIQKTPPEGSSRLTAEEHTRMAAQDAKQQRELRKARPTATTHSQELLDEIDELLGSEDQELAATYQQSGGE